MTDVANLVLGVDSRQVKDGKTALDDLTESGTKAEKATSLLGKAYGAMIGAAVVAGWKHAISSAMEAEQASAKLTAALNATGYAAGLTKTQLDGMADSMAASTKFDDESIRNASAVLLTFRNVQGDTFERGIKLAADMASMLGSDLTSASLQVGKALNDPVRGIAALSRAGVQFSEVQKDQIKNFVETNQLAKAQEIILGELQGQLGGTAEAMNTGLAKATRDTAKAWDELYESIGKTALVQNTTIGVSSSLTDYLKNMKAVIDDGDWLDRLAFFTVGYTTAGVKAGPAVDPEMERMQKRLASIGMERQQEQQAADAKHMADKEAAEKKKKLDEQAAKDFEKLQKENLAVLTGLDKEHFDKQREMAKQRADRIEEEKANEEKARKADTDGRVKAYEELENEGIRIAHAAMAERKRLQAEDAKEQHKVWKTIEKTAHDSFVNIYKGGTNVFEKLKDTIENTLIETLYQMTMKKWIVNIETQVTGAGGFEKFMGGLFGGVGGGGSGAVNLGTVTGADMDVAFDGGGYTGSGARSGGLDGKGGFVAMLHPQETVIDHTKGGASGGGITINNSPVINVDSRTDKGDIMRIISQAVQNGNAQLMNQLSRAGKI
jgi:phage-related minor tail protein